jgi:hypothetical protein
LSGHLPHHRGRPILRRKLDVLRLPQRWAGNFRELHGGIFEVWLLAHGVPFVDRHLVRRASPFRIVPVAEMEGQKGMPGLDIADGHLRLYAAAPRRNANPIPGLDTDFLRVLGRDLEEPIGRGRMQCDGAPAFGAGVEMLDDPAGRKQERIVFVGLFGGRAGLSIARPAGLLARYFSGEIAAPVIRS